MLEKTFTVRDRVFELLQKYPATRGDYRLLIAYYRRDYDNIKFPVSIPRLRQLTSEETIRRRAQELFHQAKEDGDPAHILPTERTLEKRSRREIALHGYYGRGQCLDDYMEGR